MKKILFVDDDENILGAFQRQFRKQYTIETALGPEQGLTAIESGDSYAVLVVDMNMPGMNGVEFLKRVRARCPDIVRVMLTGNADQNTAVQAVNEGHIFRFLNKPCSPDLLAGALDAGLRQHELITAERDLLENTLSGSVRVLSEMLSMALPKIFERSRAMREEVRVLARHLGERSTWDVEVAAMLAQIGFVAIPPEVILKARAGQPLTPTEKLMVERVPEIGHNLLAKIPRMEKVARIILYQAKQFDGVGYPADGVVGDKLPLGARLLKFLGDLSQLEAKGLTRASALELMRSRPGHYDPLVLDGAIGCFDPQSQSSVDNEVPPVPMSFKQLSVGLVLAANVETPDGSLIVCAGNEVTQILLERLRNFSTTAGIREPIYVRALNKAGTAPTLPTVPTAAAA
ncbi:MAG: response regulator [Verrucomicrobiales bacterium]|nr:response regulator [Verrucomicrobiales bacterium]